MIDKPEINLINDLQKIYNKYYCKSMNKKTKQLLDIIRSSLKRIEYYKRPNHRHFMLNSSSKHLHLLLTTNTNEKERKHHMSCIIFVKKAENLTLPSFYKKYDSQN